MPPPERSYECRWGRSRLSWTWGAPVLLLWRPDPMARRCVPRCLSRERLSLCPSSILAWCRLSGSPHGLLVSFTHTKKWNVLSKQDRKIMRLVSHPAPVSQINTRQSYKQHMVFLSRGKQTNCIYIVMSWAVYVSQSTTSLQSLKLVQKPICHNRSLSCQIGLAT